MTETEASFSSTLKELLVVQVRVPAGMAAGSTIPRAACARTGADIVISRDTPPGAGGAARASGGAAFFRKLPGLCACPTQVTDRRVSFCTRRRAGRRTGLAGSRPPRCRKGGASVLCCSFPTCAGHVASGCGRAARPSPRVLACPCSCRSRRDTSPPVPARWRIRSGWKPSSTGCAGTCAGQKRISRALS